MPKATIAGHPAHPFLITAPAALLPFSLVMDAVHLATGDDSYAEVAYRTMQGGVAGGGVAAVAGAADYLEIPSGTHEKRIANLHAGLNVGLMGLYGVNLALRRRRRRRRRPSPGPLPVLLSAVGTAALVVSAWYGGHLVYEHGVRVKGIDPIDRAPSLKPPGDDALVGAAERAARPVPARGPES